MKKLSILFSLFISFSKLIFAEPALIDTIPPSVRLVWPDSGSYVSCEFVVVEMVIKDDGFFIDRESILLSMFSPSVLAVAESMASIIDSFYYFPIPITFADGDSASFLMNPVYDFLGNFSHDFWFHFYIDRKGPNITDLFPSPGSVIPNPRPPISATIADRAGVSRATSRLSIDGVNYSLTSPFVSWTGDRFTFRTDFAGLFFRGGDIVEVCVHAEDLAEGCGFNASDTCWSFSVPSGGPIADLTYPPADEWMSCPDSGAVFRIEDADGIEPESLWVVLGTDTIRYGSAGLDWSPPSTLRLELLPFGDGWFNGELHACDIFGNPLDPALSFSFGIDTRPPILLGEFPPAGSACYDLDPTVTFRLADAHSGMMHSPTLVFISVDGSSPSVFTLSSDAFSFDGSSYWLDPSAIPPLKGGDTVTVGIYGYDTVTVCPVNQLDTSWYFYIPATPPTAELILPVRGIVSACPRQGVWFSIEDDDGIIPSSIRMNIGAATYGTASSSLSWDGETLRFEPTVDWTHGAFVSGQLSDAYDSLLNNISAPVPFDFYIDLAPPQVVSTSPTEFALVHDTLREVRLRIEDSPAGVDPASLEVTVNGTHYTVDGSRLRWSAPYLTFLPSIAGAWNIVDTVEFCLVRAADLPDTCGPNISEPFCLNFFVDGRDPFADPPEGAIVACLYQGTKIYLWAPGGIIPETIEFEVNSHYLTVDSAGVSWDGETLSYVPSVQWPDGDSVRCRLINADGPFGGMPEFRWGFLMDYSPPVFGAVSPVPMEVVSALNPPIVFNLADSVSGLLPGAFELTVGGSAFDIAHPALSIAGSVFTFSPSLAGMHIAGGDTVEVCLHAEDLADPDYCGPNILDTCYRFFIESGGPSVELLSPEELTPFACDSVISILISDHNGVDWTALELIVAGEALSYSDPRLTIRGDTLFVRGNFASGETVLVELTHIEDLLENPADRALWRIVFDFEPPIISWLYPSEDTTLTTISPVVRARVRDLVSGWDWSLDPPTAFTTHGDTILITPSGITAYDTLEFCISACDSAVCPNCASLCRRLFIDTAPPTADLVVPRDSVRSACDPQRVVILLADPSGISATGLAAFFGADTVTLSDPRLRLLGDSLIFEPTSAFPAGEVRVGIIHLEDRWGNVLSGFTAIFYSIPSPGIISLTPSPGTSSATVSPTIEAASASADSAWLEVDGATHLIGGMGLSFDGSVISLDASTAGLSWIAGDTVEVCAGFANFAELCGPAVAESCWSFFILYSPPLCEVLYPECRRWSACRDQSIEMLLSDEEGIDTTSIEFTVNGAPYGIGSPELSFDPVGGILEFSPSTDWTGDSVVFCLNAVSDILGAVSGDLPLCCTILLDFAPPEIEAIPSGGAYLPIPLDTFEFILRDLGSGAVLDSASLNGLWFGLTDEELSFADSIGRFYFWETLSADPPESITVCASASDLTLYCGPNDTIVCWRYGLNITAPILSMIFPQNGSITSCAAGPLVFIAIDPDGIDTESVALIIDGESMPDSCLSFSGDTIRFAPTAPWPHGSVVCGSLTVADPLGSTSAPLDFCITIDIEPPSIVASTPTGAVLDTFAEIRLVALDAPAGVDYSSPVVLIDADTAVFVWRGDTLSIDRAPFGLCEFDTVEVRVIGLADLATACGVNTLADTAWSFTIVDDDTAPPSVVLLSPSYARLGLPTAISARLSDSSGVYSAYILWAVDSFSEPESLSLYEVEPGLWATAEGIDISSGEALFVRLCATDGDFDCENSLDRSSGCFDYEIPLYPIGLVAAPYNNEPWNPSDEFGLELCAGEEFAAVLAYFNPETVSVRVDSYTSAGDSVFRVGAWADSLVEPGDSIYLPVFVFAREAGNFSDTIYFFDSALGYPVAVDTIWANIVLCEFRAYPNPFTPNGDGFYDRFIIELPLGGDIEINIYRLEGVCVASLSGDGRIYSWDGTDDFNRPQPPGIYLWVIRVDGEIYKHGSVTLAR